MSFKGLDPQSMRHFASQLSSAADRLGSAHSTVSVRLGHVPWHGDFADRFRGDWHGPHRLHFLGVTAELRTLADLILREATEQENVSRAQNTGSIHMDHIRLRHDPLGLVPGIVVLPRGVIRGLELRRLHPGPFRLPHPQTPTGGWTGEPWPGIGSRINKLPHQPTLHGLLDKGMTVDRSVDHHAERSVGVHGAGRWGTTAVAGDASATVYADAHAAGRASLSRHGLDASGEMGVAVGASATAGGMIGSRNLGVGGRVSVKAEARAQAAGAAHVGRDGVAVKGSVSAEAVVSADAKVTSHAGGVDSSVGVHAYAGAGVHAKAEAAVTAKEVKMSISLGAAIGVGAGVDYAVDIHPQQVLANASKFAHHLHFGHLHFGRQ